MSEKYLDRLNVNRLEEEDNSLDGNLVEASEKTLKAAMAIAMDYLDRIENKDPEVVSRHHFGTAKNRGILKKSLDRAQNAASSSEEDNLKILKNFIALYDIESRVAPILKQQGHSTELQQTAAEQGADLNDSKRDKNREVSLANLKNRLFQRNTAYTEEQDIVPEAQPFSQTYQNAPARRYFPNQYTEAEEQNAPKRDKNEEVSLANLKNRLFQRNTAYTEEQDIVPEAQPFSQTYQNAPARRYFPNQYTEAEEQNAPKRDKNKEVSPANLKNRLFQRNTAYTEEQDIVPEAQPFSQTYQNAPARRYFPNQYTEAEEQNAPKRDKNKEVSLANLKNRLFQRNTAYTEEQDIVPEAQPFSQTYQNAPARRYFPNQYTEAEEQNTPNNVLFGKDALHHNRPEAPRYREISLSSSFRPVQEMHFRSESNLTSDSTRGFASAPQNRSGNTQERKARRRSGKYGGGGKGEDGDNTSGNLDNADNQKIFLQQSVSAPSYHEEGSQLLGKFSSLHRAEHQSCNITLQQDSVSVLHKFIPYDPTKDRVAPDKNPAPASSGHSIAQTQDISAGHHKPDADLEISQTQNKEAGAAPSGQKETLHHPSHHAENMEQNPQLATAENLKTKQNTTLRKSVPYDPTKDQVTPDKNPAPASSGHSIAQTQDISADHHKPDADLEISQTQNKEAGAAPSGQKETLHHPSHHAENMEQNPQLATAENLKTKQNTTLRKSVPYDPTKDQVTPDKNPAPASSGHSIAQTQDISAGHHKPDADLEISQTQNKEAGAAPSGQKETLHHPSHHAENMEQNPQLATAENLKTKQNTTLRKSVPYDPTKDQVTPDKNPAPASSGHSIAQTQDISADHHKPDADLEISQTQNKEAGAAPSGQKETLHHPSHHAENMEQNPQLATAENLKTKQNTTLRKSVPYDPTKDQVTPDKNPAPASSGHSIAQTQDISAGHHKPDADLEISQTQNKEAGAAPSGQKETLHHPSHHAENMEQNPQLATAENLKTKQNRGQKIPESSLHIPADGTENTSPASLDISPVSESSIQNDATAARAISEKKTTDEQNSDPRKTNPPHRPKLLYTSTLAKKKNVGDDNLPIWKQLRSGIRSIEPAKPVQISLEEISRDLEEQKNAIQPQKSEPVTPAKPVPISLEEISRDLEEQKNAIQPQKSEPVTPAKPVPISLEEISRDLEEQKNAIQPQKSEPVTPAKPVPISLEEISRDLEELKNAIQPQKSEPVTPAKPVPISLEEISRDLEELKNAIQPKESDQKQLNLSPKAPLPSLEELMKIKPKAVKHKSELSRKTKWDSPIVTILLAMITAFSTFYIGSQIWKFIPQDSDQLQEPTIWMKKNQANTKNLPSKNATSAQNPEGQPRLAPPVPNTVKAKISEIEANP